MRRLPSVLALASLSLLAACGGNKGGGSQGLPPVATPQEALAQLPAPYNTGDLENGKAKFSQCRSCHTLTEGGPNGVGPNLWRIFGQKAGDIEGYQFSDALKNAGFTWDAEHLDKWIKKPKELVPGTKMTFAGMPDDKDRVDLIAYLKVQTSVKEAK